MAIRTVEFYDQTSTSARVLVATIYFNSGTRLFYAEEACQTQVTRVPVPRRLQYTFTGYRIGTSSTSTLIADASGNIVYSPTWTSSGTTQCWGFWTQLSKRYYFKKPDTATYTLRTTEFFRAVAPVQEFYEDDQLTRRLDRILLPYNSGQVCAGMYSINSDTGVRTDFVDADGYFAPNCPFGTWTSTSDTEIQSYLKWYTCYKMTLNSNGGIGGEANPIWHDRVHGHWSREDTMLSSIDSVTLPTYSGKIFTGYWTASSGGTKVIDANGRFLSGAQITSSNKVFYAQWANPVKVTLDSAGGTGAVSALYHGGGVFFSSSSLDTPITSINPPTLANNRFLGFFNGVTKVINSDGTIVSSFAPSAAVTIVAHWERVSYTIAIQANGGIGIAAIYANAAKTAVYANELCEGDPITTITPLVRPGYRFLGIYTTNDVTGVRVIDGGGVFTSSMSAFVSAITGNTTVYAIWQQVHTITLNPNGGAGTPGEIYYDDAFGQFYDTPEMTTPVTTIIIPSRECYRFMGFALGCTTYIDATGHISASWTPTADTTLTAVWERRSWRFGLDPNGGTGGTGAIYRNGGVDWYADDACAEIITHIQPPTRDGYTFAGFYANNDPAQVVVDEDGLILASPVLTQDNNTSKAIWTANTYTLTFDPNGGTTPTTSKSVTFGQPIGTLPTATRRNAIFKGWEVGGVLIDERTLWEVPANTRAAAVWELQFGDVVDYFAFASASLKPIASNSGDNRQHICVTHTGKFEPNVNATSGVWRNPSVTYVVTRNMTLNVTLGKAFVGSSGVSGFMITNVEVHTQVGQFPTVTISAVANEGRNAINQFLLSVNIVARAKAQNLMGAISGGGKLNAMSIVASCDPVVIAENMMPVASDVVHGKITASADTIIINHDSAPIASGGFSEIGTPKNCTDAYYSTWHIDAEKEI